jgi:uncharacterized membrane protein
MTAETDKRDLERLVNLTDAALAITLTLMMLDIRLPGSAEDMSDDALWRAILDLSERYVSYALSFVVVGVFWISHRQKFRHLVRADGVVVWLDILFLLVLGLVPFVTTLIAENGGAVATIAYAAVMAALSVILVAIWWHALRAGLTAPHLGRAEMRRGTLVSLFGAGIFLASMPIALLSADAAKYFWLLLFGARALAARIAGKG